MKNLMTIAVASWLMVTTAIAQSPQQSMPGMDMSQHDMNMQHAPDHANHTYTGSSPAPELLLEIGSRPAMNLAEFIQLADANNPTIKQAAAIVRRSTAQAKQAGLYPNPSIGYQGEQIRGGSFGGGEHGAYIAQSIVLGGKLGLRRNIYDQQKKSDEAAADAQIDRVHGDVTQMFYKTLASQEIVVVQRRILNLTLDAVETVHQLANVGQSDAPDVLQSEVESEQAKIDYANAQRNFILNFRMLAAVAGEPAFATSPLDGALDAIPDIDTDHIVETIIQNSPAIKQAQLEITVAEATLKDAKKEPIPDLQLKAGEQYNFETVSVLPTKAAGPQSFASVSMNIPIWNRNQGAKQAAQADIDRAEQELQRVKLSLRQQAEPLVQTYLSSKFEADRYRTQLIPRASKAYQLYLQKYQNMAAAYPQVLVSQRTLFHLQASYIQALGRVWQNAIALQHYTLTGGLAAQSAVANTATSITRSGEAGIE
jgi:outer membrane protein, heavy metal efflux system